MRILVVSVAPIFKEYVHGGSQRILLGVLKHLSRRGYEVTVLCNKRKDNKKPFKLFENVTLLPNLRFRSTFLPSAYQTAPYNLAHTIHTVANQVRKHDILYLHADGFLFKRLLSSRITRIPIVASLQDFVYEITMVSAFDFCADRVIVPSQYIKNCLLATGSRIFDVDQMHERIHVIPNGIDLDFFKPLKRLDSIRKYIEVKEGDLPILFPHRPEKSKGITDALRTASILKKEYDLLNIKLLIPKYIDIRVWKGLQRFYENIYSLADRLGVRENLLIYEWLPDNMMAEYYSMGKVTLCIGNFVESFGLIPLESVACGTPAVVSNVGAMRNLPSEHNLFKIDYGDIHSTVDSVLSALYNKLENNGKVRRFIAQNYSFTRMVKAYESAVTNAEVLPPLELKRAEREPSVLTLAPWCYITKKGLYSDYRYGYLRIPRFLDFIGSQKETNFTVESLLKSGFSKGYVKKLIGSGILVPSGWRR